MSQMHAAEETDGRFPTYQQSQLRSQSTAPGSNRSPAWPPRKGAPAAASSIQFDRRRAAADNHRVPGT
eukprot:SAG11_NODE_2619_length_3169_cov_5.194788_5_plen_68_part_00